MCPTVSNNRGWHLKFRTEFQAVSISLSVDSPFCSPKSSLTSFSQSSTTVVLVLLKRANCLKNALKYTLLPDAFSFPSPCYPPDTRCSSFLSLWSTSDYSNQRFPSLGLLFLWTIEWCKKCRCLLAASAFAEFPKESQIGMTWDLETFQTA